MEENTTNESTDENSDSDFPPILDEVLNEVHNRIRTITGKYARVGDPAAPTAPCDTPNTSRLPPPDPITFRPSPNTRNRNYRNRSDDSSNQNDEPMAEDPAQIPEQTLEGDNPRDTDSIAGSARIVEEDDDDDDEENEWEDFEEDYENDETPDIEEEDNEEEADEIEGSESSDEENPLYESNSSEGSTASSAGVQGSLYKELGEGHPLFKKDKPKNNWFAINEIEKRQLGFSAKLQSRELFQRRCYGSLHCVKRLELMYKLEEHAGCVNSLNFHPNGSLLASGSDDLKVVVWDWQVGKTLMKYKTKHRGNVFQSKFLHLSGDLHIATCARDGQVRLAQLSREEGVKNARLLGTHKGPCHKIIVLPEQPQIILSAGEDGLVLSHDVRGPKSSKVVSVHDEGRSVALYSIHGHPLKTHEFCVSGRSAVVRVYDQRKSSESLAEYIPFKRTRARRYRGHHVTCAVYNYDGTEILASYSDQDVYLFDTKNPEPAKFLHQYQGHRNGATIKGVNFFGPKSEFVVSGSDCGHIYFWERNSEALVQWLLADDNGVVNCLEPHPQLPFICTSGLDWDIKVWVPSCEDEPTMEGLGKTITNNYFKRTETGTNESRMLWVLWQHLRASSEFREVNMFVNNSSGSEALSNSDSDDADGPPNCHTS